uniref:phenylalanine--tRNA ligase n=1 Tax=Phallusia mammillata TaxID=59560 RepID=A0A6F9DD60_9ASCI|nr:phenylalanine--tRNA ligase alpha subunit [Phallusia mammillata]
MDDKLQEQVLKHLDQNDAVDSNDLAKALEVDHQNVVGIIKSLQCFDNLITVEPRSTKKWELSAEGKQVAQNGSYEYNIFSAIPPDGISQSELMKKVPNSKIGFSKAMSNKWIKVDKDCVDGPRCLRKAENVKDLVRVHLNFLAEGQIDQIDAKVLSDLKKRKLASETVIKSFFVKKGKAFTTVLEKPEADLTAQMLQDGSWKSKTFKDYNYNALGVLPQSGHLHPLMKVRSAYRQIFLEMGFSEMPTNNFVESSFWNFDALFQPQQHPARDAHDTFFIKEPAVTNQFPMEYLERVKKVHSEGGYGSQGYRYDWKIEEAQKNVLRTHTTAVSSRMLYALAQQAEFKPVKYFSIDRVFRNETLDSTHLAEFHQVEGVVADRSVTLGDLMGILREFFRKLGIHKLRFKPAYNPYTEPSMEVFGYHNGLGKWVEIGNSGVFRPEMLRPMGLPEDVNVIAWGLSLERPTMIKLGIDNIRDLCGHKVDLQMVYDSPICQMDF